MILDNLSKRVVIPALKRCSVCGEQESEHDEADHEFKLDESVPKWAGWYTTK
jgi:formylmethanofuran dehydrogenase subunit E